MLRGVQGLKSISRPGAALVAASCVMGYHCVRENPSESFDCVSSRPDDAKTAVEGPSRQGSETPDASYQSSLAGSGNLSRVASFEDTKQAKLGPHVIAGPPLRGRVRRSNFVLIAVGTYGDVQVPHHTTKFSKLQLQRVSEGVLVQRRGGIITISSTICVRL